MLVCKHWKGIVEWSPILWTDVWLGRAPKHVDPGEDWIAWLEALFARSRTMPLTLTILVSFVDLEAAGQVLLQHFPRCKALVIQPPESQTDLPFKTAHQKLSSVHHILSFPLPNLQNFVISGSDFLYNPDRRGPLLLDAPNLQFLSSYSSHIIPFVKAHGSPPTHDSLETFSFNAGWRDVMDMLPRTAVSLPGLKTLNLTCTDDLWTILQILDTPNLERLVVQCGLADWFLEVDTPTPVLSNLRELTWYTDPGADNEIPNLLHLLQHCPNMESFLYSCKSSSPGAKRSYFLTRWDVDDMILALCDRLDETHDSSPRLCPRLKRLQLASASYEQVRELVLLRPALEYVSLQYRTPGEDVVRQSKATWREKVDLIRWIKSKVDFELERNEVAVGSDLEEEEGVVWDPSGRLLRD
ncbi:hypothetical protein FS837_011239 [Tulasnella sp. UAMH 9824]|nr:hypothetical protein FS837_011239 [Tulasnella sp. UAMH 9824]